MEAEGRITTPSTSASHARAAAPSTPVASTSAPTARVFTADELAVAGLVHLSTVDWPGHMVATVFLQGCPWNCLYCHNPDLIDCRTPGIMEWAGVEEFLQRRRGLLDGVVFTGGEPTRQRGLGNAMRRAHMMGFQVGVHTMGAYPTLLRPLLPLLDWVGFDIKAAPEHYGHIIATTPDGSVGTVGARHSMKSLDMVLEAGIEVQARTTLHPGSAAIADLPAIVDMLRHKGVGSYRLQQARADGARQTLPDGRTLSYDRPGWDAEFNALKARYDFG